MISIIDEGASLLKLAQQARKENGLSSFGAFSTAFHDLISRVRREAHAEGRAEALEAAAKVLDAEAELFPSQRNLWTASTIADLAGRIRALAGGAR